MMNRLAIRGLRAASAGRMAANKTRLAAAPARWMSTTAPEAKATTGNDTSSNVGGTGYSIEDDSVHLTGQGLKPVTNTMEFIDTAELEAWPVYRILGREGNLIDGCTQPENIGEEQLVAWYKMMVRIQVLDDIFYNAQRQGRISFYMQNAGEEATHVGSASALGPDDVVFAQYREVGILLYRGFTLQQAADQCFSNEMDLGKGRQMPVHYGSNELNYQTISSPLATQLPQAVGAAYALKREGKKACTICYFGEGAASEGDFHAALNFAATSESPVIFFCRNNGYAISTPVQDQFRGDGIVSRAAGYGMKAIRVDGNDIFAVHQATAEARRIAIEEQRPVLIEAMSYRRGHHSTSDDSTRYRSGAEIKHWQDNLDPVKRTRAYMESKGWWSEDDEKKVRDEERISVMDALTTAETRPKPNVDLLFTDVYKEIPEHLIKQQQELRDHMAKYPEHYEQH